MDIWGCLTNVNKVTMNILVHVSLCKFVFISLVYIPMSRVA